MVLQKRWIMLLLWTQPKKVHVQYMYIVLCILYTVHIFAVAVYCTVYSIYSLYCTATAKICCRIKYKIIITFIGCLISKSDVHILKRTTLHYKKLRHRPNTYSISKVPLFKRKKNMLEPQLMISFCYYNFALIGKDLFEGLKTSKSVITVFRKHKKKFKIFNYFFQNPTKLFLSYQLSL